MRTSIAIRIQAYATAGLFLISVSAIGPVLGQDRGNIPTQVIAWADMVLVNGKIAAMDDNGINTNVGTTAEAMAIRDEKILALGSNSEIAAMAGPETQVIDLMGRTVIPGIIDTHSHLFQYAAGFVVLLQNRLGEECWAEVSHNVIEQLQKVLGNGPVKEVYTAHLGVGVK